MKTNCPNCGSEYELVENLKSWARIVKEKGENKCAFCKDTENIEVHHILPMSKFPQKSLDIQNGVCVCKGCHTFLESITDYHFKEKENYIARGRKRKKRPKETDKKIKKIIRLYKKGRMSQAEIGRQLGLSRSYVNSIVMRYF